MLSSLHIRNYVLIDSLDIEFSSALNVITGPTGAGKSVIIGAMGLLMGAKADAGVIACGADNCVIEGEFVFKDDAIEDFCHENDIDYDGGRFIIRRVVSSSGRSRAFVNDEPVSVAVLGQLAHRLVDIHSQHDTLLLTDRRYQMSILDAFASNGSLLGECSAAYSAVRDINNRIAALQQQIDLSHREADYHADVCSRLDKAGLHEGELANLEQEQFTLSHSGQIKDLLSQADALFHGEDDSSHPGIDSTLCLAERLLEQLSRMIPSVGDLSSRLQSARLELKDIGDDIAMRNDSLSCSPERLQAVDDRLAQLYDLLKRFGCADEAELIALRESSRRMAFSAEDLEAELSGLKTELAVARERFDTLCAALHESRVKAVPLFNARVLENLSWMELETASFEAELISCEQGPFGSDELSFMFSATPTGRLVPVAKCASGGELSRIMLSLKQIMSQHMNMPTMVFDEIDTGVSGSVADRMGSMICRMGENMQVFAITHLPQVAAKGSAHFMVEKTTDGVSSRSTMKKLSDQQRVHEIARMLSGSSITDEALANARALLLG